jgi:curved DNA-binding protein
MPNPRGAAGDLYAEVKVMVPAKPTARERELFEQLAAQSSFDPRRGR